jgi:hypothetical protein
MPRRPRSRIHRASRARTRERNHLGVWPIGGHVCRHMCILPGPLPCEPQSGSPRRRGGRGDCIAAGRRARTRGARRWLGGAAPPRSRHRGLVSWPERGTSRTESRRALPCGSTSHHSGTGVTPSQRPPLSRQPRVDTHAARGRPARASGRRRVPSHRPTASLPRALSAPRAVSSRSTFTGKVVREKTRTWRCRRSPDYCRIKLDSPPEESDALAIPPGSHVGAAFPSTPTRRRARCRGRASSCRGGCVPARALSRCSRRASGSSPGRRG